MCKFGGFMTSVVAVRYLWRDFQGIVMLAYDGRIMIFITFNRDASCPQAIRIVGWCDKELSESRILCTICSLQRRSGNLWMMKTGRQTLRAEEVDRNNASVTLNGCFSFSCPWWYQKRMWIPAPFPNIVRFFAYMYLREKALYLFPLFPAFPRFFAHVVFEWDGFPHTPYMILNRLKLIEVIHGSFERAVTIMSIFRAGVTNLLSYRWLILKLGPRWAATHWTPRLSRFTRQLCSNNKQLLNKRLHQKQKTCLHHKNLTL